MRVRHARPRPIAPQPRIEAVVAIVPQHKRFIGRNFVRAAVGGAGPRIVEEDQVLMAGEKFEIDFTR